MADFDMPAAAAGFPARGRWLINQLMLDLSITQNQAAGIVGNIGFESGGLMKLHEIGQPEGLGGYGWGQWTASRRRSFLAWDDVHHLDYHLDEANYGYLLFELTGDYKSTVNALRATHTVEQAVWSVGQTYERPGGTTDTNLPGYSGRLAYANRALSSPSPVTQTAPAQASLPNIPTPAVVPGIVITQDIGYVAKVLQLEEPERMLIQVGLGVDADGIIGPQTKAALAANRIP